MELGLYSKLGDKYKRVVLDTICLGFTLSRGRVYIHPWMINNCCGEISSEHKIRNTFVNSLDYTKSHCSAVLPTDT